jgi:hypothetical protein
VAFVAIARFGGGGEWGKLLSRSFPHTPFKNRAGIIFIACGVFSLPAPKEFCKAKFFLSQQSAKGKNCTEMKNSCRKRQLFYGTGRFFPHSFFICPQENS